MTDHEHRASIPAVDTPLFPTFSATDLLAWLDGRDTEESDLLDFGVITIGPDDRIVGYNRYESERAGIRRDRVLGRDLFVEVAPCINNYLVAELFHAGGDLDLEMDYVFTFRMRPTPVRLRLLAAAGADRRYLAIRPR
ncbi:hypothetical protein [Pseudonocardia spirodelae]|uniref:Photoactive yellow protein n=1 Tax=Pseudonocardia spirodelae TaxID=3133431 RepID=A0ABU8T336_9PSEU